MPHRYSKHETTSIHTQVLFSLSVIILCFAPLMRAGKMSFALLLLELLGIMLLVVALWYPDSKKLVPRLAWLLIVVSVSIPLLYLIPIPIELWQSLPGRELYNQSLVIITNTGKTTDYLALSLIPDRTVSSFLTLLPILGIFISTLLLPKQQVIKLIYVFLGVASFQAALGLIQYGSGSEWAFWFGVNHGNKNALGTYSNYDHFAALMELAIPIALALTAYNFRHKQQEERDTSKDIFNQTLIFFTLSLLLILGSIFSRSRTGIALMMLAILLSSIVFARHLGGQRIIGFGSVITVITLGIAANIGLIPVLNRFALDPVEDVRWEVFTQTWIAIQQFFPIGTGLGTFQSIFMAFHPPELPRFVNHAHNDYLELLLETGIFGIFVLLLSILIYISGWIKLYFWDSWGRFHFIQTAAGISLLLMLLHGMTDFNFHTPANSIFFAFLSGVFLHKQQQKNPH